MSVAPRGSRTMELLVNPHGQTQEKVNEIIAYVLGVGGCLHCGRLIKLNVEFGVDPAPDAAKAGVIAVNEI
jgi:hypothetical protein